MGGYQGREKIGEGTRTECKFPEKNVNFVHLHDSAIFGWDICKIATKPSNMIQRVLFRPETEQIWTIEC